MGDRCKSVLWDVAGTLVDFNLSLVDSTRVRLRAERACETVTQLRALMREMLD